MGKHNTYMWVKYRKGKNFPQESLRQCCTTGKWVTYDRHRLQVNLRSYKLSSSENCYIEKLLHLTSNEKVIAHSFFESNKLLFLTFSIYHT